MTTVTVLPSTGRPYFDVRDGGRSMRVSWHPDADLFVFSLWRDGVCTGTFRLDRGSTPDLIDTMVSGLAGR
ncbi:MAG TPA: hypothetical protein VFE19_12625 [Jatrophihabitantaceae bacterium]|jgi:hypothetical protein|nr:hypothetical protein [Jatrophihabitantaceae bacterium]